MNRCTALFLGGVLMVAGGCATSRQWYDLPTLEFSEVEYPYEVHHAQIKNVQIAYMDEGRGGHTLLLIHGLGSNAKAWLRNIPAWSADYRVITVDLPGYGRSSKGYYEYSLTFYAQVLSELLDQLQVEQAIWVGHSMGGQLAMVAALDRPDRVAGLVLVSPAGLEIFDEGEGDWLTHAVTPELVRDTSVRHIAVNLESNFYDTPDEAQFMITDRIQVRGAKDFSRYCYAVSKNVRAMVEAPVRERLGELRQPTLVLFGEQDRLIPNPYLHGGSTDDVAEIARMEIPNSQVHLLPDCGHFAQFEKAERTNQAVLEFLQSSLARATQPVSSPPDNVGEEPVE